MARSPSPRFKEHADVNVLVGRAVEKARPEWVKGKIPSMVDALEAQHNRYEDVLDFEPKAHLSQAVEDARRELRECVGQPVQEIIRLGRLICPIEANQEKPRPSATATRVSARAANAGQDEAHRRLGESVRNAVVSAVPPHACIAQMEIR